MTNFHQELHDALPELTAPQGSDKPSTELAGLVMGYDPDGISYQAQEADERNSPKDQLPLSLVLHMAPLRMDNPTQAFSLENVDPMVSLAQAVADSLGRSESALPYELLLLERLSAPSSGDKPRMFDLDQKVDWSQVAKALEQELTTLEQALGSRRMRAALGQPVGGNLPLGQSTLPLLCERGLVVAPAEGEDTRDALARGLYLLERYNRHCRSFGGKSLFTVGIYSTQGDGERSLRVFELPRILPMDSFMSLYFGI